MENLNIKCAEKILSHMGEVVEIENPVADDVFIRPFIRAIVIVNVFEPLFSGCWIPRRNLSNLWVEVKYEKLNDMCFNCGVIGDEQKTCKEEKVMSAKDKQVPRFGQRMSVPPAKEINEIMEVKEQWKQRAKDYDNKNKSKGLAEDPNHSLEKVTGGALFIRTQSRDNFFQQSNREDLEKEVVQIRPWRMRTTTWRKR